jgi:hypothetical protein
VKQQLAAVRMLFDWLTKRAEVTFSGVPDIAAVIAAVGVADYECMVENANSSNLVLLGHLDAVVNGLIETEFLRHIGHFSPPPAMPTALAPASLAS